VVNAAGTYSVLVTGANGCTALATATVSSNTTLNVGSHPDYQALVDLYTSTNGATWGRKTGWLQGCDPCTGNGGNPWFGLSCANGRVTQVNLSANQLNGSIPTSLSALTNLQYLELAGNQLGGSIPASLSALTNLQQLNLAGNQLNGMIPASLGALTNLQRLSLNINQLSGSIPASLSALTNLTGLYLNSNQLSGCFPASLTALCSVPNKDFTSNPGLPGGGSAAAFLAFCTTGAGSDAFVASASASQSTATVGGVVSLSTAGGGIGAPTAYNWTVPVGALLSSPATANVVSATLTTPGQKTFTVVVSFGGSCTHTAIVSVTAIAPALSPTISSLAPTAATVCAGTLATFTATVGNLMGGTYSYTLSNGSGPISGTSASTSFSQAVSSSGSGVQSFTLSVSSGGQSAQATTTLTVNALPTAGLVNNGPLTCTQTSVTLTASGGTPMSYTFANGGGVLGTTNPLVVSVPGTYSVTVANANGCRSSTSTTVIGTTVYTLKNGSWNDASVWSVGRLPLTGECIQLKHEVTIPTGHLALGGTLLYDPVGKLIYSVGARLQLGQ